MSAIKRILKAPLTQTIAAKLLAFYIRLVYYTAKIDHTIDPDALPYMNGEKNAIFVFWHSRIMMMPTFKPRGRKMQLLVSHHRDGQLIANVSKSFKFGIISGSSSKGGAAAVKNILQHIQNGDHIGITPDGPRGPREKVKKGILITAKRGGIPIIPVAYAASRSKRTKSWDRFMIAYPFSHIAFCVDTPIDVSKLLEDQSSDEVLQMIQSRISTITQDADQYALQSRGL